MVRDEEENAGGGRMTMCTRGPYQLTTCPTVSPKLSELGQRGSESEGRSPGGNLSRRPPERCCLRCPQALRRVSTLSLGSLSE